VGGGVHPSSTSLTTRFSNLTSKYMPKMLGEKKYNSRHEEGFFYHFYY
jgi:hypothetical protein